jgi:hypothetical protein
MLIKCAKRMSEGSQCSAHTRLRARDQRLDLIAGLDRYALAEVAGAEAGGAGAQRVGMWTSHSKRSC